MMSASVHGEIAVKVDTVTASESHVGMPHSWVTFIASRDGQVGEVTFHTSLDNMEEFANSILRQVKAIKKEQEKEAVKNG